MLPADYPQLGPVELGRAELVVNGEPFVANMGAGTQGSPGVESAEVLLTFGYVLTIELDAFEPGEYRAEFGELEATWSETELPTMSVDADCGDGQLYIEGVGRHPFLGFPMAWGTLAMTMCDDGEPSFEVSGRFTVTLAAV
jgi:hypothetical protein